MQQTVAGIKCQAPASRNGRMCMEKTMPKTHQTSANGTESNQGVEAEVVGGGWRASAPCHQRMWGEELIINRVGNKQAAGNTDDEHDEQLAQRLCRQITSCGGRLPAIYGFWPI